MDVVLSHVIHASVGRSSYGILVACLNVLNVLFKYSSLVPHSVTVEICLEIII